MKYTFYYIGFIVMMFPMLLCAQQGAQYSLMKYDKYKMNPAYAGLDFSLSITGNYRNQWQGVSDNPSEQNINAHMPFYLWSGALGLEINNDQIGVLSSTTLKVGYNFIMSSSYGLIGIGGKMGINRTAINSSAFLTETGEYIGGVNHNDPILNSSDVNGYIPSIDMGVYFKTRVMELGVSIDNVSAGKRKIDAINLDNRLNVDLFFEYVFPINDDINLTPSMYVQSDLISTQSEIFVEGVFQKKFSGGIGFRGYSKNTIDAIYFSAGAKINDHIKFYYSYDFGISGLSNFYESTHELIMNYNLNKAIGIGVPQKIIYNPRFL